MIAPERDHERAASMGTQPDPNGYLYAIDVFLTEACKRCQK
ncbi:hypothetical protein SAMN05216516_103292 [Izhakiella capsodis]|uniref:Uncharacterized protein n=1 Tax=Izhakiella capsodis TaxID=1367852 RepID=A0A1I4X477_9GAMM|nr:hypothetical protein SAMN05216516_103292 [Izhakiella capsodis]